ncbi:MAG TPA: type II and III secretion system protein, partial [Phycisphaeraceae bacterium]
MLDARVVVLERNDLLQLGVEWNFPRIQAGAFTDSDRRGGGVPGPDWPWAIRIGYTPSKEFTNALLLTLNLLAQNGEATIVSSPQLMAEDAREAGMSVTTEEYFQIVSEGVLTQVDLETIESGTTLKITPRVGDQDQITLEMAIEVSDVVSRGQDNLPVVTRRKANTTVRVRDGGTAVIAGLMDSRTELIERNVPGAADVPMLGHLFQNDAATNESKQLAVFITATLVDEAELTAESQRDKPRIAPVDEEAFRRSLREAIEQLREDLP